MGIQTVVVFGKTISTAKSEKKVGNKFFLMFGKVFSTMLNTIACWLFTWMISNSQVPLRTWTKHGQASNEQSTLVTQNHMIGILVVNMWEFNNVTLPRKAHPFAHVFDSQAAAAARTQHRTNDFWQHDPVNKTWTRYHLQPRKKLFEPGDEGGELAKSLHSERVTMFDKNVEFKGLPVLNMHMSDESSAIVEDDMTVDQKIQTKDFWTGRTIFRYGDESGNTNQFALPSKNRPGPHRDKRESQE